MTYEHMAVGGDQRLVCELDLHGHGNEEGHGILAEALGDLGDVLPMQGSLLFRIWKGIFLPLYLMNLLSVLVQLKVVQVSRLDIFEKPNGAVDTLYRPSEPRLSLSLSFSRATKKHLAFYVPRMAFR